MMTLNNIEIGGMLINFEDRAVIDVKPGGITKKVTGMSGDGSPIYHTTQRFWEAKINYSNHPNRESLNETLKNVNQYNDFYVKLEFSDGQIATGRGQFDDVLPYQFTLKGCHNPELKFL